MTTLTKHHALLDSAKQHNAALETNYLALALDLVAVKETGAWEESGYESFADYYIRDLGREKSTVSRLLAVGEWMRRAKLPAGNLPSYKRLAAAIAKYPDETPEKVLAIAEAWTDPDFKAAKKAECKHPETVTGTFCSKCWHKM